MPLILRIFPMTDADFSTLRTHLPEMMDAISPIIENFIDVFSLIAPKVTEINLYDIPSNIKKVMKLITSFNECFSLSLTFQPSFLYTSASKNTVWFFKNSILVMGIVSNNFEVVDEIHDVSSQNLVANVTLFNAYSPFLNFAINS